MADLGEWVSLGGCSDDDGFGEDEELLLSSEKVASLERDVQERDAKVASLSRDVQERDAMIAKLKHEMEQIKKDRDASREDMVNLEKGIFANVLPAYTQETSMLIIEKDRVIKRLRDSWNDVVDANQSHKVRIIEMEKELAKVKQANPFFHADHKQMTSLKRRLSNIHNKHNLLVDHVSGRGFEYTACATNTPGECRYRCLWINGEWIFQHLIGKKIS
jgi:outer membrane murein-binding lipoprotein Lpp